ncbi:MAG TPA: response regulator transcription factor [Campylobacterales bacterium]|nr:response regulator transcription factor [Campylobacterales bacterium]
MNHLANIVIIGEDETLVELKQLHLQKEGLKVMKFNSLHELGQHLSNTHLIIINNNQNSHNGIDSVKFIREKETKIPIIFLAEELSDKEIEEVYASGTDDCIVKPFSIRALICKIKVFLKRTYGIQQKQLVHQNIVMDLNQRTCSVNEKEVELTKLEFDLLSFFIQHKNMILEREYILECVWKDTSVKKRTINVNINRLLKKIDPRNTHNYFTPIRGIGYRFE